MGAYAWICNLHTHYCDILGPLYTSSTSTDLNGTCYLLISRGAGWLVGCFSLGKARQPVAKLS